MSNIITVDFKNDTLFAVDRDDGVFVAITPIAKSLGISPDMQRKRIQADPILSEGAITTIFPSAGGAQDTFCLRLDLVHGWLFTIDESRVRDEETRQRVLAYKRECYAVLFRHFYGRTAEERRVDLDPIETVKRDQSLKAKRSLVTEARQTHGLRAAQELWRDLGLPMTPSMSIEPRQGDFFATSKSVGERAA